MSGHNRWSKIKRQKAAMGNTKGRLFTKVIREITIAAKAGGADPEGNHRLRSAMDAARAANMPNDSIVRAIKKGTGELEGVNYEEMMYEGYGPAGVALIVECVTDNKNRTAGEVRHLFQKGGGNMGDSGSVAWMFEKRGIIELPAGPAEDAVMEAALDLGAADVLNHGEDGFEIRTEPPDLLAVADGLLAKGFVPGEKKVAYVPRTALQVEGEKAEQVMSLIELLEDCDDVQNVHANFEVAG